MADPLILVDDPFIFPVMMKVLECVQTELDLVGGPGLCWAGFSPAGQPPIPMLNCKDKKCGVLWVSPMEIFEYDSFPLQAESNLAKCGGRQAARLEVGIARCAPRGNGRDPVDVQASFEAMRLYMAEAQAIRRALKCCVTKDRDRQVAMESWTALPLDGGVSGGTWSVVVA